MKNIKNFIIRTDNDEAWEIIGRMILTNTIKKIDDEDHSEKHRSICMEVLDSEHFDKLTNNPCFDLY